MSKKFKLSDLEKLNPCTDGFNWYEENIKTEDLKDILIELNNYKPDWSRWLMVRMLNKKQNQEIAIFSAKSVLHIYEDSYPDDKRVRECIEAVEKYLLDEITRDVLLEKRRAAYTTACVVYATTRAAAYATTRAAAYAAYAASDAANAAAYASDAAAADAASDAAHAAHAANAANAAAHAAAAARKKLQEKIINKAIELLDTLDKAKSL